MSGREGEEVRALLGLDRMVHEPARLAILTVLAEAGWVEFRFLERVTGLTRGNLSSHAAKLEEAGYIEVEKAFRGKVPVTRTDHEKARRLEDIVGGYWRGWAGAVVAAGHGGGAVRAGRMVPPGSRRDGSVARRAEHGAGMERRDTAR